MYYITAGLWGFIYRFNFDQVNYVWISYILCVKYTFFLEIMYLLPAMKYFGAFFHRWDCFNLCLDSWSFLQFDDFPWGRFQRQRWKNWFFQLLSEISDMLFHDLFYRDYDFWISPSWSLQSRLGQRYKKVRLKSIFKYFFKQLIY